MIPKFGKSPQVRYRRLRVATVHICGKVLGMPLAPATRLGSYEIVAPLGAGGMGEVYHPFLKKMGFES